MMFVLVGWSGLKLDAVLSPLLSHQTTLDGFLWASHQAPKGQGCKMKVTLFFFFLHSLSAVKELEGQNGDKAGLNNSTS